MDLRKFFTKKRKESATENELEAGTACRVSGKSSVAEVTQAAFSMNFLQETLRVLVLSVIYLLEAFVKVLLPVRKKSVAGETVLITGAGSGIGRVMAAEFSSVDVTLVLWDINLDWVKETARMVKEKGARSVHCYQADCSDRDEVYRVAEQVKQEVGDVTILINNAGIVTGKKFMDSPDSLIEKTLQVNTMAHFWTYKAFLPAMTEKNHGHLVCIASSAGLIGVNGLADYCASKFAAVGFAESVALELLATGKDGVKTTIVCPYFIDTGMFDGCGTKWPRFLPTLQPEYAAKKILNAILTDQTFLLMPRSMYLLVFLKSFLPFKVAMVLGMYFGAFNFMDAFKGRKKKAN